MIEVFPKRKTVMFQITDEISLLLDQDRAPKPGDLIALENNHGSRLYGELFFSGKGAYIRSPGMASVHLGETWHIRGIVIGRYTEMVA